MSQDITSLQQLVDLAADYKKPFRIAVVDAAQEIVIETLKDAASLGMVDPILIGDQASIIRICRDADWEVEDYQVVQASSDSEAAAKAADFVRTQEADAIMKGQVHTDTLMHELLDKEHGLRLPGQRVSHVFLAEIPGHPKLIGITDAAINISPDLNAKAQILQNAIDLFHVLGIKRPKAAVLSAIETVNPAIQSTLDAASLTLMAQRNQINGAIVDGPLAFDNAISSKAAREKGIHSSVAGDTDILLAADLVSGNILAKALEYLAEAVAAGILLGLSAPVILTSRADPAPARLASIALARLVHHRRKKPSIREQAPESSMNCSPQKEESCCPVPD